MSGKVDARNGTALAVSCYLQKSFQLVDPAQGLPLFTESASSRNNVPGCMYSCKRAARRKISDWFVVKKSNHWRDRSGKESNDDIGR